MKTFRFLIAALCAMIFAAITTGCISFDAGAGKVAITDRPAKPTELRVDSARTPIEQTLIWNRASGSRAQDDNLDLRLNADVQAALANGNIAGALAAAEKARSLHALARRGVSDREQFIQTADPQAGALISAAFYAVDNNPGAFTYRLDADLSIKPPPPPPPATLPEPPPASSTNEPPVDPPQVGEPPVDPPQVDPPDFSDDQAFFRALDWVRRDPAGPDATVTKSLRDVRITGPNRMTFVADSLADWPATGPIGDGHGVMAIAAQNPDGTWRGGKFDHVRANTRERDFNNLCGYNPVCPQSGETVRFWLLSYDGRQASNVVEIEWP